MDLQHDLNRKWKAGLMYQLKGVSSRDQAEQIIRYFFREAKADMRNFLLEIDRPVAETFVSYVQGLASKSLSPILEDMLSVSVEGRIGFMMDTTANLYVRKLDAGIPGIWDGVAMQFDDDLGKESTVVTEVSRTSNLAAVEIAKDFYPYKQWNATLDKRTRPNHREAHGQIVPIDRTFLVGTSEMNAPGDWQAPPEETQNCRCSVYFIKEDETVTGWYRN